MKKVRICTPYTTENKSKKYLLGEYPFILRRDTLDDILKILELQLGDEQSFAVEVFVKHQDPLVKTFPRENLIEGVRMLAESAKEYMGITEENN